MSINNFLASQQPLRLRTPRIGLVEGACVVAGLILVLGMFKGINHDQNADMDRSVGSPINQLINITVFGFGLAILVLRGLSDLLVRLIARSWPLLILIGFALLSTAWSDEPAATARRAVALMLSTSFAYVVVARFSVDEFVDLLFGMLVVYLIVGVLAAVVPGQGITPSGTWAGAWRGFSGFKNEFGRVLALSIAFFCVYRLVGARLWRTWWIPAVVLASVLLVLSQSKTSIVVTLAGVFGAVFLQFVFQPRVGALYVAGQVRAVAAVIAFVVALLMVFVAFPIVVEMLGRDMTLTGRTKIWAWAFDIASERPWLGSGFRAFWVDANTKYFGEFFYWTTGEGGTVDTSFSGPANGHSGYVDLWLELGIVGVTIYVGFLISAFRRVAGAFAAGDRVTGCFLAMLLSFAVVYNVTERVILEHTESVWFLICLFYLYGDRELIRLSKRQAGATPAS